MKKTIRTEFNNLDTFINFIKPKLKNVNFENDNIFNNLKTIFIQHQSAKATITIKWLEDAGFDVMSVWESDYLKDKGSIIAQCLTFLER